MNVYQRDFIEFALKNDVLTFGSFELKSGRISPYLFNSGLFNSGKTLAAIGTSYAAAFEDANFDYGALFGPAYKEKKDHAEGGIIVDYPLNGKIVIVDDEITAGTAINESIQIIKQHNAQITGVLVAVDRAEVTPNGSGKSAIQAVAEKNNIQVGAIITIDCIMEFMEEIGSFKDELEFMREYKAQYGIKKD